MPTTKAEINIWLDKLYKDDNLTHMIVAVDSFDYSDFPVYVGKTDSVHSEEARLNPASMQHVMEVYSKSHDRIEQLNEKRAFNYD